MAKPTKPKDLKPKADEEAAPKAAGAAGGGGGSALDIKFVILLVVMVVSSILGSAGSVYLMTSMVVTPEIQKLAKAGGGGGEHGAEAGGEHGAEGEHGGAEATHEVGMNLELDEFMINLKSDPTLGGNQYLKAKMALSIKPPEKENCYLHHEGAFRRPQSSTAIAMGTDRKRLKIPQSASQIIASSHTYHSRFQNGQFVGAAAPILPVDAVDPLDRTLLANEGGGPPPCETDFKHSMGRFVPTIRDVVNSSLMKRTASQLASAEGQETLKDDIKEQLSQMMAPDYEVLRVNFQDFIIQK